MKSWMFLLPLVAGIAISLQSGVNNQLRSGVQQPLTAAFISFFTGTLTLFFLHLITKTSWPSWSTLGALSWYQYTGGILGVMVVSFVIISVPVVGAANMFILMIAGQLFTAVLMDRFGWLGMPVQTISLSKIAGIILVITGAYLVTRK